MRRGRPPHPELLTPREQEVLALIREGLTNEQIGQRLGISESGARYHVSEILSKLGVERREEAAAWRAGETQPGLRRAFDSALVILARKAIGGVPVGVLVAVPVGAIVLAAGVFAMSWRGGDRREDLPPHTGESAQALAAEGFLDLSQEAIAEARRLLPSAELVFVAYATPSRQYTFRFREPGTQNEVSILGPNEVDTEQPRWETIEEERPPSSPAPAILDLTLLQNSFEDVAEEAASQSLSSAANMGIVVFNESGKLTWNTTSRNPSQLIRCEAPDTDLSLMQCDPPVPPAGKPTQMPTP